jgi:hypothetical protein
MAGGMEQQAAHVEGPHHVLAINVLFLLFSQTHQPLLFHSFLRAIRHIGHLICAFF